jgi:hypothetical protein
VATLELKGACQGGKTGSGNPFRASLEGERRRGSRVTRRHGGGRGAQWGRAPMREMRRGEPVSGL